VVGLQHAGSDLNGSIDMRRVFAAALSLGATAFFHGFAEGRSCACRSHDPDRFAGHNLWAVASRVIEVAVRLLSLQAICFNRLAGLNYSLWVGPVDSAMEELRSGRRLEERKESVIPKL